MRRSTRDGSERCVWRYSGRLPCRRSGFWTCCPQPIPASALSFPATQRCVRPARLPALVAACCPRRHSYIVGTRPRPPRTRASSSKMTTTTRRPTAATCLCRSTRCDRTATLWTRPSHATRAASWARARRSITLYLARNGRDRDISNGGKERLAEWNAAGSLWRPRAGRPLRRRVAHGRARPQRRWLRPHTCRCDSDARCSSLCRAGWAARGAARLCPARRPRNHHPRHHVVPRPYTRYKRRPPPGLCATCDATSRRWRAARAAHCRWDTARPRCPRRAPSPRSRASSSHLYCTYTSIVSNIVCLRTLYVSLSRSS